MSNSLQSHQQHARLPCPSLSPRFCSNLMSIESDAIQPSHTLLSPSPLALSLSQHQGLFQWVSSSQQVSKVLELQHQSFQWIGLTGLMSLLSEALSRIFSSTLVRKYQFFSAQPSLWSNSHNCTWLLEKIALTVFTVTKIAL